MLAFDYEWSENTLDPICIGVANGDTSFSQLIEQFNPSLLEVDLIGHNIKEDLHAARRAHHLTYPKGKLYDTLVMAQLVNETWNHELKELAYRFFGHEGPTYTALKKQYGYPIPLDVLMPYNRTDAELTWKLYHLLNKLLRQTGTWHWFESVEVPLTSVLFRMEVLGIALDPRKLEEVSAQAWQEYVNLYNQLIQYIDNPNSDKQVASYIHDTLGLPILATTKGGSPKVDEATLKELDHPFCRLLLAYREVNKLITTYLTPYRGKPTLHTDFRQTGTVTGRLSSARPNLQNIPKDSDIRHMFVARPGYKMITIDYSQMEYRLLAILSNEKEMLAAFDAGYDIHQATAASMFHKRIEDVTKDERSKGKTLNFAVVYGLGERSLAQSLGVSRAEASQFAKAYWSRLPAVQRWIEAVKRDGQRSGIVPMAYSGRARHLTPQERAGQPYKIPNIIIQGTCSDVVREAMVAVDRELRPYEANILLQVHDELVIESPEEYVRQVANVAVEVMEANRYNLPVECKIADRWEK